MADPANLAMLNIRSMNDFGTKRGANPLMSQTYTKNWNICFLDQSGVESKIGLLCWSAWAR